MSTTRSLRSIDDREKVPAGHNTGRPAGTGYRKVVVAASIGNLIEIYDLFIYGYFATTLAKQFFPDDDPIAGLLATFAIFAVGFCVRPIGGIIFGHVGDRAGRRAALASSLLLMTVATIALGLLPTHARIGTLAPVLLLVCRILQGLSASAETPGSVLLILEHCPAHQRGRLMGVNSLAANLGTAAAAAVGLMLAELLSPDQLASWGWRVAFLVAAPIGLVGLYVRVCLLDSPVFRALSASAKQGRAPLIRAVATAKGNMLVFMTWIAVTALGAYIIVGFLPSYLIQVVGLSKTEAFRVSLIAILIQGGSLLVSGYLADRLPLRGMAIGAMAGVAITVVPGFWIISEYRTVAAALIGQCLWGVFVGAANTVGTTLSVTLFPAAIRFTAIAVGFNLSATLFGGTAPYISTWLISITHSPLAPGVYLFVVAIVGMLAAIIGLPRGLTRNAAGWEGPATPSANVAAQTPTTG